MQTIRRVFHDYVVSSNVMMMLAARLNSMILL
jgi:hypothetical protein